MSSVYTHDLSSDAFRIVSVHCPLLKTFLLTLSDLTIDLQVTNLVCGLCWYKIVGLSDILLLFFCGDRRS